MYVANLRIILILALYFYKNLEMLSDLNVIFDECCQSLIWNIFFFC